MKTYSEAKGPGATTMEVYDREGKVVLAFPNPVQWAALDPGTAVQIAEAIVSAAKRCGFAQPLILVPRR